MLRKIWPVFGLFLVALAGGCAQETYQYTPSPAVAVIPPPNAQQSPPVTAMATVVGVVEADSKQGIPESVQVRLRVQNSGAGTVMFDPTTMQLTDGSLLDFLPPRVQQGAAPLALNQSAAVDVLFPFPPGYSPDNTNLQSLELRWQVQIDKNQPVQQVVDFHRVVPVYYYEEPYYYPYGFYGGVVIVHRR
jgi:hypothetical protein